MSTTAGIATSGSGKLAWIAAAPSSLQVLETARRLAGTPTNALIMGETGTGKDQLARWIHEQGPRHDLPFLKIDCASLPAELVESELFGHERGAFTGAVARKLGRIEMAQSGTIVLDEVAALSPAIQAKLLRVLDDHTFERLGGTETLRMEARIIALTNTDLKKAVSAGRFREDLFFRLNVLAVFVPPLRERREDISRLVTHFLARLGPVHGRVALTDVAEPEALLAAIDPGALKLLESHDWPGNVRELKNTIEHALIFSRDLAKDSDKNLAAAPLQPRDFPQIQQANGNSHRASSLRSLEELEREAIKATLEETHYKIGQAAEILGISRKTLLEKRKRYGLI